MKRFNKIFLLAAVAVILLLAGCGQNSETVGNNQPLKVGLVMDEVGSGDGGFNDAANSGLAKAEQEFGDAIVTTVLELSGTQIQKAEFRDLAQKKLDLIIVMGVYASEPVAEIAQDYPETQFVLIDSDLPNLKIDGNITCVRFKDNEGAFLAGAAAALKSQSGIIGFIGGADISAVKNFETGYTAGAKTINPKIKVFSSTIAAGVEGFNNPDKACTLALDQISKGADIIFHAAGASGNGVFKAVAAQNKLAIGADIDQTFSVPENQRSFILTSVIKGIDTAVFDAINFRLGAKLEGGCIELGIKDGVEIYAENDVNKAMLAEIKPKLDELKDKIIRQDIVVPAYQPL